MSDIEETPSMLKAVGNEIVEMTAEEAATFRADQAAIHNKILQEEADRIAGIVATQTELKELGLTDAAIVQLSGYPYPYQPETEG